MVKHPALNAIICAMVLALVASTAGAQADSAEVVDVPSSQVTVEAVDLVEPQPATRPVVETGNADAGVNVIVEAEDTPAMTMTVKADPAAEHLAMARAAMEANDLPRARMYYTRALAVDPGNTTAKAGLERIDALLGRGERSLLEREADRRSVEQQRVIAKVNEAMKRARSAAEVAEQPADYNIALDQLRGANRLIDQSQVLSPTQAEDLREQVQALASSIQQTKLDLIAQIEDQRREQIQQREQQRTRADMAARERQIESLWTTAQQLAVRHEYSKAVATLDQLLIIAPQHEKARRFRQEYQFLATQKSYIDVRLARKRETQAVLTDAERSATPWEEIYRYPEPAEWERLTERRRRFTAGGGGESEAIQATRRKLQQKGIINGEDWSISLQLTATSLGSVLDFIAEAARAKPREINIIVDRQGIEDVGIMLDDPVDLSVKDVSIEQALKMVLGPDLGYRVQNDGSVLISSRDRLNQDLPVVAYFVGDLITQVPDFGETVPSLQISQALDQGDSGGGGGLFADTTITETEDRGTERLRELIERQVRSTEPWESMGGRATLDFYERSGLMLVSQTADGHQNLQNLLEQLRRERAIMISIEARFVTVSDAFLNDITVDFDITFLNAGDSWRGANGDWVDPADPAAARFDTTPVQTQPGPDGILGTADDIATLEPNAAPPIVGSTSSNGQGTATLQPGLGIFNGLFGPANWGANEGGLVISGVMLDNIQLGFLIRAIQADRRSTTLFAPRITLWNGQRAWISDGTHSAYVSDLEPVVAEAAVGWDPEISWIVSGTVLDVKATASADRRYVQLDLRPQVALPPNLTNTTQVQAVSPQAVANATIVLPVVRITELNSSVSVPDGGTLLVGGVKLFEEHDVESGVPVLSKVPVLKRLFANRAQVRGQQNLLILVQPTIIIQAEREEELGTAEID